MAVTARSLVEAPCATSRCRRDTGLGQQGNARREPACAGGGEWCHAGALRQSNIHSVARESVVDRELPAAGTPGDRFADPRRRTCVLVSGPDDGQVEEYDGLPRRYREMYHPCTNGVNRPRTFPASGPEPAFGAPMEAARISRTGPSPAREACSGGATTRRSAPCPIARASPASASWRRRRSSARRAAGLRR